MAGIKLPPDQLWWRGGVGLPGFSSAPAAPFTPADLSPALWIDPSDASTVTISGSSGAHISPLGLTLIGGTNYATCTQSAAAITDDLDVRVKVEPTSWVPGTARAMVNRSTATTGWAFYINPSGTLGFTIPSVADYASTAATGLSGTNWVRVTRERSSGNINFYTSSDGASWTKLGATVVGVTTAIAASANPMLIGITTSMGLPMVGWIKRAIVMRGIAGTVEFDADFEAATDYVSAFTESALGAPVYVVSSTATSSTASYGYVGPEGLVLPGTNNDNASLPAGSTYDITGDIDIVVHMTMPDWTHTARGTICGTANASLGYRLCMGTNGRPIFTAQGSSGDHNATAAVPFTDGQDGWVRVTRTASPNEVKFYTSTDGTSWTQLGSTVTTTTSLLASSLGFRIGSTLNNTEWAKATIHRVKLGNIIGAWDVLDVDFTTAPDYATSFTESSSNAATVTITATNTPMRAAGALVSQINDKSGNARHLTQATAANMPKYWNGRNGNNCLVFDGTNDQIGAIDWTGLTNNGFTAAYVRVGDTAASKIIATFGADLYAMWSSSSELLASYITAGGVTSVGTMNRVIGSSCMTDASASAGRAWLDGTLTTGTTNSAATGGTLRLGQSGSSTLWFSGEIGELFICTSIPTSNQITDTHDYIKAAWGTP